MALHAKAHPLAYTPAPDGKSLALDALRVWIREAIDESGEKHDSVARALRVEPPYFSQMLSLDPRNQKPIQWHHVAALPDNVEAIVSRKYAESFGLIVVQPCSGDQAVRNLVSGLFGVLGSGKFQNVKLQPAKAALKGPQED